MKVIEKHALWLRVTHWINGPLLGLMIWSGILIYWANDVYWVFFPLWFYDFFNIPGRLAEGLALHFFVAWLFILNGAIYFTYLFTSGHWRELAPGKNTLAKILPTLLHELRLKELPLEAEKFNVLQRLVYSVIVTLGVGEVITGFAIYKPVQLHWLIAWLGGYQMARKVHFIIMLIFIGFTLVHVLQVMRSGWNNFRAMVAGFALDVENDKT